MKLHADAPTSLNTITAYGPGFIEINAVRHSGHLIVAPDAATEIWNVERFETLTALDFERLLERRPELVLLGTGLRQRLPHPRLTVALSRAHVGIEAMDTGAACRTYNVLMAEGRRVIAALLQED